MILFLTFLIFYTELLSKKTQMFSKKAGLIYFGRLICEIFVVLNYLKGKMKGGIAKT